MTTYATSDELREWLDIGAQVQDRDLPLMDAVLEAVTEAVDDHCGRSFAATTTSEARVFPAARGVAMIDDAQTITLVEESSDRVSWTTVTDYLLDPPNGLPKTTVLKVCGPWVRATGTWGYGTAPSRVKIATLMKAAKVWKRKGSPTGVEGFGDFGVVRISRSEDPDVAALLGPLVRGDKMGIA